MVYQLDDMIFLVMKGKNIHAKLMDDLMEKERQQTEQLDKESKDIHEQFTEQEDFYKRMFEQHSSVMLLIDQRTNKIINANFTDTDDHVILSRIPDIYSI